MPKCVPEGPSGLSRQVVSPADGPIQSLRSLPVVVVDCQATGASPERGHLLELGWARMCAEQEAPPQVHSALVLLPLGASIPPTVTRLTGLSDDDLVDACTPGAAWAQLRDAAADTKVAVIHYARFEESFVRPLHRAMTDHAFPFDVVCTHAIARRLWPDLPRCGLRAVAGYLGHPNAALLRSGGHVDATVHVWREVVARLEREHGVTDLPTLRAWLAEPAERTGVRAYPMPRDKRLALPQGPGVYRMLRSNGDVLYVGKATSLRRRVNSYFQKRSGIAERTLEMLSQAQDLHVIETTTGLEAALLESDEIKALAPPYNVALRGTGRSLWYASRGFASLAPEPSARHPIGPLSSAWWPGRYAALVQALRRESGVAASVVAALGGRAEEAEVDVLLQGLAEFEHRLPPGGLADDRAMMRFGAQYWAERKAQASVPDCDDTRPVDARQIWDRARVVATLEELVLVVAHAVRRAAWLRRLSESSIAWSEPGRGAARHVLVLQRGRIVERGKVAPGALPPRPLGAVRSTADRHASFDLATYDRLRVLTTELRRIADTRATVQIRVDAGRPLSGPRLHRTLRWV